MHQSELSLFAQDFRSSLAPLRNALESAAGALRSAPGETPFDPATLQEACLALEGELCVLLERVANERATVFVFGPAKSGKSTLLDALAGAAVSEVSILPGYPCVARARHGERESGRLQRFDGASEDVSDPAALTLLLQRAHPELAARVRAAAAAGEAFDPARHLRRAVRRIERVQPAEPLARGALELVECPPIHAPLFPSYAEMLLGEPDHARAGVFVVRAAQLCDDAVFDGVEELLAVFERLILVINLDERARELSRAGELAVSPEREDPARLIAAFEGLSTCEPLAGAVRSGSVPVLALDLLEAARARRQGTEEGPAASARQRTRFQDLLQELSGVLDAHETLRALEASALRRAGELCDEADELAQASGLGELSARRDSAARERAALESVQRALERLAGRDRARWEGEEVFAGLRTRLAAKSATVARELARELEAPITRALEDWFGSEGSLADLLAHALEPRLVAARAELARAAERLLRDELKHGSAAPLSAAARADLDEARLALDPLLSACAEAVHAGGEPVALRALDVHSIPVRPKLGQRLVRRGANEVRRALLGPPEAPTTPLSSSEKARRLGDEARAAMQRSAVERAQAILAEEARRVAGALLESLQSAFVAEVAETVARERARLEPPLAALAGRLAELSALADALAAVAPACARARGGLAALAERCRSAGVLVPVSRRGDAARAESTESEQLLYDPA